MKLQFTGEFDIDFQKEIDRINKVFADDIPARDRQLEIIILFMDEKFNMAIEAYNNLPYNNESECPEQEFVGRWFWDIMDVVNFSKFKTSGWKLIEQELNIKHDKEIWNEYVKACRERMSEYTEEERKKLDENLNEYLGITQETNDPQQRDVT